jgi:hypothetical protein
MASIPGTWHFGVDPSQILGGKLAKGDKISYIGLKD